MKGVALVVIVLLAAPAFAYATGCDDYPYTQGINVEEVDGGIKIISTAEAIVTFDDTDSVKDARDEAMLEAKSQISAFMSEGIRSEQAINKAVKETKSMQGESKTAVRNEVIERVKHLSSSTQALLRGVVPLGECYTKGSVFRVSVGIKPETTKAAENLAGQMTNPHADRPRSGSPKRPSGVEGYSRRKELDKF